MFKKFFAERERKLAQARAELAEALEKRDEAHQELLETPARLEAEEQAKRREFERKMAEFAKNAEAQRAELVRINEEIAREHAELKASR